MEQETIKKLIEDPKSDGETLDKIAKTHFSDIRVMEALIRHPNVKPQSLVFLFQKGGKELRQTLEEFKNRKQSESREIVKAVSKSPGAKTTPKQEHTRQKEGENAKAENVSLYQQIQSMTVSEKVQFAMKAGKDARSLLIKDSNRQVSSAVLTSPKITEDEVLLIAQSRNVSDELLRIIAKNRDWMKNYSIMLSLASNPKTPIGLALPMLHLVKMKDLGTLSKSRNVPEAIRSSAARLLALKQKQS